MNKNKNLQRLHNLVDELADRDDQLKRDMQLFNDFFDSFPIPVTVWSITKDKTVISQRGNGFVCPDASSLNDLFECDIIKETSIENHELALAGTSVDYFVQTDHSVHYVKLVPRLNEEEEVSGVSGIAWDVTINAILLSCLEDINTLTKGRRGAYRDVHKISQRGISASRLRDLLLQDGA